MKKRLHLILNAVVELTNVARWAMRERRSTDEPINDLLEETRGFHVSWVG